LPLPLFGTEIEQGLSPWKLALVYLWASERDKIVPHSQHLCSNKVAVIPQLKPALKSYGLNEQSALIIACSEALGFFHIPLTLGTVPPANFAVARSAFNHVRTPVDKNSVKF
jgi:hypothetical protein